uniref:Uncharacterized protein n=1 Tax=Oryza punctata TaxID=4537 RepID=A0A0E0MK37_ORYPU
MDPDPDQATVMVLLDRRVPIVNEVTDVMKERGWSVYLDMEAISSACAGIMDWKELGKARERATLAEIRRVRADQAAAEAVIPRVVGVPGLSYFGLRLSSTRGPEMVDTSVAGADHNILALYVGRYRPGIPSAGGFYLVYDAWADSLSAIPPLPPSWALGGSIASGVLGVLRHALPSDYVLAEIVLTGDLPKATLWMCLSHCRRGALSISLLAFNMGGRCQRSAVPCAVATTASSDTQNTEQYMVGINVWRRQAFSMFKFPAESEGTSLPRIFPSNFSSYLNKVYYAI